MVNSTVIPQKFITKITEKYDTKKVFNAGVQIDFHIIHKCKTYKLPYVTKYVACMREVINAHTIWSENLKGTVQLGDLSVGRRITLNGMTKWEEVHRILVLRMETSNGMFEYALRLLASITDMKCLTS